MSTPVESIQVSRGAAVKPAPAVSVIIPAYNTANLIAEALDSVLAQTCQDFEAIVVNDGSPDTQALEQVLQPYRERIVYIRQENRRAAGARNTGIRESRGEYLAFLDSDELWCPEFLASQLKLFAETPSLDMAYTDALFTPDSGRPPGETWMCTCPSRGPCNFESLLRQDCHIPVSSVVVRKRAITEAGMFDESLRCLDDYDMWLRVAYHGAKISYQLKPLVYSRADRPGSLGQNKVQQGKMLVSMLTRLAQKPMTPAAGEALQERLRLERAILQLTEGKVALAAGNFTYAGQCLKEANVYFRSRKLQLTLAGLHTAPGLMRIGARAWGRLLAKKQRLRRG